MRGRKQCAASIERLGLQRRHQRHQTADRILGAVGIGDMALLAGDDQMAVERAAPADLDGVAERIHIARFAEDAVVEFFAALGGPLQQLGRAVDRNAFLVAGDQKRDRAFWLAAIGREVIEHGGERAGDAALHVHRAAAVKLVAGDLAGKRRMRPGLLVAGRHHVGVAGEHQVRRRRADAGVEIFHVVGARLVKRHAMYGEAGGLQCAFEKRQRAAFRRRHRPAAQQIAGNGDGVGGHDRETQAPSCIARRLFWLRTQPGIRKASISTQTQVMTSPTTVSDRMSCVTAIPVRLR